MSSGTTSELPVLDPAGIDDDDVVHSIHTGGTRNTPTLMVACCGEKFFEDDYLSDDFIPGIPCPLCKLAVESGVCACYYYS